MHLQEVLLPTLHENQLKSEAQFLQADKQPD